MTTSPITEREAQVLALVAERLSNAQIAHKLHISVRTVEHHVSALLRKHGVATRQQLATLTDPPTVEVPRRLAGLPDPHTSFVGRDTEQDLVRAGFTRGRLVTLLGPGGVGKTRLAVAVAQRLAPEFGNRGGFVDLVPVTSDFVEPAVAATLGVSPRPRQPLLETITGHLGDQRTLLILDSCEHVLDAAAELITRLLHACPAAMVLATSRERLRLPGEHTLPLEPLSVPNGVTLFRDRVTAVDPRFTAEPDLLAQICTRLDGMPLAIELAAARAPALGAPGLLAALNDVMRVLTGARNPDPRHRSLRAVLDWSHHLLDQPERTLLRRLAIFAGPFDLPAATTIADTGDLTTTADLLARLVEKNLVVYQPHHARWRLLDTVRAYARQQLTAAGEHQPVRQRHLRWAQAAATTLENNLHHDRWQHEFDAIVDDLRSALHDPPPDPGHHTHRLAQSLGHLTYARRHRQESIDLYRQAAHHAPTPTDAAAALRTAADCAAATFRADLAYQLLLTAADKARQAGDDNTRAAALARAVGLACRFRAQLPVAIPDDRLRELHQEAVAAADPGDPVTMAATAITAAWTADPTTRDPALAEQALTAAKATGDPVLTWAGIATVATVYERRGELRRAYQLARTGLPLLDELDPDDPGAGEAINAVHYVVTMYATSAGRFQDAIDVGRAAALDPAAAEPTSLANMLIPPLVLTGEFDEALRHADAMWHAWQTSGRPTAGRLWFSAATAALARGLTGDLDGFRIWRNRMRDLAGPQNVFRLRTAASALFADARMAVHTGDVSDAAAIIEAIYSDPAPGHRHRVFSYAAAAELAVVAALPDAPRYIEQATALAEENDWAAACLARARGRYHHDPDALHESLAAWERVGARFEHAYTRQLLPPEPR